MRNHKEVNTTAHELISITCDICGTTYDDILSIQEFLKINNTGGYSSHFGDGIHYECDICEKCVKGLFGKYMRTERVD